MAESTVPLQNEAGYAKIKDEYIVHVKKDETAKESHEESQDQAKNRPPHKKFKMSGKNHMRPKLKRAPKSLKLCRAFWDVRPGETPTRERCHYPNCPFNHNVIQFLNEKPSDVSDICYNFETYGFCPYGLCCRFGSRHIEDCGSKINEERYNKYLKSPSVLNTFKKEVQISLRKKKYDFSLAEKAAKFAHTSANAPPMEMYADQVQKNDDVSEKMMNERLGPTNDEDLIRIRPSEKKKIDWSDKLYLAPLTTVGNLPFRRICKKFGADITCSEMAVATGLLQGTNSEWALVRRHHSEDCFGVQLCGGNVNAMIKCAQLLNNEIEMDFIDINMGCPIDLIYKKGAGSALMRRMEVVREMVTGMNQVLSCPVTLKMRTGIYNNTNVACSIIKKAKLWDVGLIALHGRSKEKRFIKSADWNYIDECAKAASPMPLFGNGDILTYDDYLQKKNSTSVTGIMIGRGALIKPWIFTEIKEQRNWDISSTERFDILKEYVNYGFEHWGSDSEGIEKTRRFLLEWLSFLYRYIPVGLLEQRQELNQRPPQYIGRNDLETLMASRNVKDWIKISEMLLGPVPDDFEFLPKHKANSWG